MLLSGAVRRLALAGQELEDPEENHRADEAGKEAEDPAAAGNVEEQAQDPATDESADDTNGDVCQETHGSVSAHDLGTNPASQTANDDPAEEAEGWSG